MLGEGLGAGDSVGFPDGISVTVGTGEGRGELEGKGLGAPVSVGLGLGAGESVGTMPEGDCVRVGADVVGDGEMGARVTGDMVLAAHPQLPRNEMTAPQTAGSIKPVNPASSTVRQSRTGIPGKETDPVGLVMILSPPQTMHGGKPGFGAADGSCAATESIKQAIAAPNSIN